MNTADYYHLRLTGPETSRTSYYSMFLALPAGLTVCGSAGAAEAASIDQGPWWLGSVVTVLAAFIGASAIVWQLARQHHNETIRQTENFKGQLKLQVYQEFSTRLSEASSAVLATASYALNAGSHVDAFTSQVSHGLSPDPIADRAVKLIEVNSEAAKQIVETILLLEKYFIIHPDLEIFRLALSSAAHDVRETFHSLFQFVVLHFPMDVVAQDGPKVANIILFTPDQRANLGTLISAYYDAEMDVSCYLDDMRTELQMLLLSDLFPHKIPRRRPADPSKKVITLDPHSIKSLRQHFLKSTAWGKQSTAVQLEIHRDFHGRG